ncbi:MBL fold metallo-hydrolase [Pelodictyon phaeoclathratiforme]|jgi:glyoxylase-like metal-dependent hydrolase (beta-lactamase superfamily II)|uniref:Beta-lactamase domain protein n=1 Tax=Pelodictyon phaeoclathratiforme (strain DSM 5477 / BU-1) TaxID=324925 RepID=B4SH16_PELPB|nr:MBL fold metallo-hydrolase [Pelodictyon phaeoclathratiforme]ACF45004.1 beta-lactamase domain protein [Pelodictyon phaeoclathratiforme BU-1]MBV5288645.1 MBL fold metallo-hydrolase [Pelodictyon phaeoclathratiforme]
MNIYRGEDFGVAESICRALRDFSSHETMKFMRYLIVLFIAALLLKPPSLFAGESLALQKVVPDVYAIIGGLDNRTAENLGNNATFGFVVTSSGVILIDSGASWKGAEHIDSLVRSVTGKPVTHVINTGGQDHRWLGNGYFKSHGAKIIAHEEAVKDQKFRASDQLSMLQNLVGAEGMRGTEPVFADEVFSNELRLTIGGKTLLLQHHGWAHTPGDSFVWLPSEKIVFSGDIVYMERLPGVQEHSRSKSWLEVFDALAALHPRIVIPGHGHPASLEKASYDTRRYLSFIRKAVSDYRASGGDATGIRSIDQTMFRYLGNYDALSGRNALQVYNEMEWE